MDEYIKKEWVIDWYRPYGHTDEHIPFETLVSDLRDMKAADVAPVVRCRECKHRGTDDCIFHIKGEPADEELLLKLDNDFCSYGERKEGADNG